MKIKIKQSRSGIGWFAYKSNGDIIDYYMTKRGAIRGAKRKLKKLKNQKVFEVEI